jgi:hypothetical protein
MEKGDSLAGFGFYSNTLDMNPSFPSADVPADEDTVSGALAKVS